MERILCEWRTVWYANNPSDKAKVFSLFPKDIGWMRSVIFLDEAFKTAAFLWVSVKLCLLMADGAPFAMLSFATLKLSGRHFLLGKNY